MVLSDEFQWKSPFRMGGIGGRSSYMRRLLLIQKDPSVLEGQGQESVGGSNEEIK